VAIFRFATLTSSLNSEFMIDLIATITCPQCGFAKEEQMPPDH
jgi:hypothetical protein